MGQWEYAYVYRQLHDTANQTDVRLPGSAEAVRKGDGISPILGETLNELGRDGWELVTLEQRAMPGGFTTTYWLKRQVGYHPAAGTR